MLSIFCNIWVRLKSVCFPEEMGFETKLHSFRVGYPVVMCENQYCTFYITHVSIHNYISIYSSFGYKIYVLLACKTEISIIIFNNLLSQGFSHIYILTVV